MAEINRALVEFSPKVVFRWHASVLIEPEDSGTSGALNDTDPNALQAFQRHLDGAVKGPSAEKPNALFLGRIAWDETLELIYRVYDPEVANSAIERLSIQPHRPEGYSLDWRLDDDPEWTLAKWHLESCIS